MIQLVYKLPLDYQHVLMKSHPKGRRYRLRAEVQGEKHSLEPGPKSSAAELLEPVSSSASPARWIPLSVGHSNLCKLRLLRGRGRCNRKEKNKDREIVCQLTSVTS